MVQLARAPETAAEVSYDLIVVGAGIHGVCLALEAACRGLRPLLLEREDFGGAASASSLRILHGGLRYLQSLDLPRFAESVRARRWFAVHFPELVQPLQCVLPLYGDGLRRPAVLRAALALNAALSLGRNAGIPAEKRLQAGAVLGVAETRARFPAARVEGLKGAAVWYDAVMPSSERILMEALRWACAHGAVALNYVEAQALVGEGAAVRGLDALDRESGRVHRYRAPCVVNCTGAAAGRAAVQLGARTAAPVEPALAFNLLLDRPPPCAAALALTPPQPGARTYFLLPWHGRTLAGTYHAPLAADGPPHAEPTPTLVAQMLADLDRAAPALGLRDAPVLRVDAGLMPARWPGRGDPAVRPVVLDHAETGGPRGLFTVCGVKYTTAPLLARAALRYVYRRSGRDLSVRTGTGRPEPRPALILTAQRLAERLPEPALRGELRALAEHESVVHLDDLLLRRATWNDAPARIPELAPALYELLGWGAERRRRDEARLAERFGAAALPGGPSAPTPSPR